MLQISLVLYVDHGRGVVQGVTYYAFCERKSKLRGESPSPRIFFLVDVGNAAIQCRFTFPGGLS